jgi:hypothetical protein
MNNDQMTIRDTLAAAFFPAINAEDSGTVANAEKELGLKPGEYKYDEHWPLLVARRCYKQADAFMSVRSA